MSKKDEQEKSFSNCLKNLREALKTIPKESLHYRDLEVALENLEEVFSAYRRDS